MTDTAHPRIYEHDFVAIKRCKHGTFLYNTHDAVIGRSLDLYGEWCEMELEVLGQIIRPGEVVLDIGANIGTHTVAFSRMVGDHGLVMAFEPQRLIFQNLCANVAINALTNVVTIQRGVGNRAEVIRLPIFDPRREQNFGSAVLHGHAAGDDIEVVRIDDMHLPKVSLMKIDVEGMECDVLEGARETIARYQPALFIENDTTDRSAPILQAIDALDYDAYWQMSTIYRTANYFGNPRNAFSEVGEANVLCFHRSRDVDIRGMQKVIGVDDNWQLAIQRSEKQRLEREKKAEA